MCSLPLREILNYDLKTMDLGFYNYTGGAISIILNSKYKNEIINKINEYAVDFSTYDNNDLITCIICFHDLTYRSQFINFLKENQINEYDIIENEEEIKNTFYDILDMKSIRK